MVQMILDSNVIKTLADIKKGRIVGSTDVAIASLEAIKIFAVSLTLEDPIEFAKKLHEVCDLFSKEMPLNVSFRTVTQYVCHQVDSVIDEKADIEASKRAVINSIAVSIRSIRESIDKIGEVGAHLLIDDGDVILTHSCSTTVLSTLVKAHHLGKRFKVIVTETRPEFHGRLLAIALADFGIPVTLITDSAHHLFLCKRHTASDFCANKVILGANAVGLEGDVVGKTGASAIALAAHQAHVKVYVVANTHKFIPEPIYDELSSVEADRSMVFETNEAARRGIEIKNPVYDVIHHEDIDLIVTEMDVVPPDKAVSIVREIYGGGRGIR
ncbi:MAG: hypothetical protein L6M37_03860 [Candidatus Methylarchaceae archaeon HK02M1]|nr:hypothetical protein [Candidatus Methylarchaceae archaeon HK02M1]